MSALVRSFVLATASILLLLPLASPASAAGRTISVRQSSMPGANGAYVVADFDGTFESKHQFSATGTISDLCYGDAGRAVPGWGGYVTMDYYTPRGVSVGGLVFLSKDGNGGCLNTKFSSGGARYKKVLGYVIVSVCEAKLPYGAVKDCRKSSTFTNPLV